MRNSKHSSTPLSRLCRPWAHTLGHFLKTVDCALFPAACPACKKRLQPTEYTLCNTCLELCQQQPTAYCPQCGHPHPATSQANHLCSHCLTSPPPFTWLKAGGIYQGLLADLLQQFKFNHKITLSAAFAQLILMQHSQAIATFCPDTIVPLPLHPQRLRERGFNQAQLIARQLAATLDIPIDLDLLHRSKSTPPQSTLSLNQRHDNTRGAFHCTLSSPRRILLVDDIATTTSTARACCHTLTRQGHEVAVLVAARAILHH